MSRKNKCGSVNRAKQTEKRLAFELALIEKRQNEIELSNRIVSNGMNAYQLELAKRSAPKRIKCTTSKQFNRASIDIDQNGDFLVRGAFVPSTQICEMHFGRAKTHKMVDESGLNVRGFNPQSDRVRTKHTHLNASMRCRGQIKISGGHVNNEMTTTVNVENVELPMGTL